MENKIIKLKNVFVCENAVVAFDGKLSLINLFSEITAKGFPAINQNLQSYLQLLATSVLMMKL